MRSFPKNRRYKGQCRTEFNKIFRVSFCYRYKGVGYFCFDELFSAETFIKVCLYGKGLYTSYFSLRVSYFAGTFDYSSYFSHATWRFSPRNRKHTRPVCAKVLKVRTIDFIKEQTVIVTTTVTTKKHRQIELRQGPLCFLFLG